MPMRWRYLTVPSSPSAAAPATPAGSAGGGTKGGVPGKGTTELLARELVVVLVVPVVDVDVLDIYDVSAVTWVYSKTVSCCTVKRRR